MRSDHKRLPDSELEVMQALWDCPDPATRAQLEQLLSSTYPIAQTTLLTLLIRLEEKGYLCAHKEGQRKLFSPLVSRQEYLASQSNRFFSKLCGGRVSTFAPALCSSGLTREELAELRDLLERNAL